ncbi:dihydroorotate dehydrogenase (quinone) [Clostridium cibarium]|uniref:Dihydroorotate dehydrogenase (Quinone) n=1 Tax=Clostridium cibarium TaxID=2762247 RepID=A0ABR8PV92_9CLOT|nr:dihydroorotate dehydrogenase (quinone) [Clostridium cibarium]MBD7912075.1 dihydroorotate dehydrogenase (quinone) [Clostridium cibarium]
MSKIDEKYYIGFEGEPEIIFSLLKSNGEKEEFGIWDGYFSTIIEKVEPNENGWTGLAYYYHLDIGWFEESPWLVENLIESYEQLKEINIESFEYDEDKDVLRKIIIMFKEAIDNDEKVYISYE